MPLNIPNGFGEATLKFSLAGNPRPKFVTMGIGNRVGGELVLADDVYAAATAAGSILDAENELFVGWTFDGVIATQYLPSGPVVSEHLEPVVGEATGQTLPPNVAVLVQKRTAEGGRRNRGRMYLPPYGFSEGVIDQAGAIDSTELAGLQAKLDAFLVALEANDAPMVILHWSEVPDSDLVPTTVTSLQAVSTVATQRRRLRR